MFPASLNAPNLTINKIGGGGYASLLNSAPFYLPLNDLGAGAVNTALSRGAGSPTFTRATAAACRLSTGLWKLDVASGVARSHYYDFTPGSGIYTYGGFLSQPAATQLAVAPRDMTNAAWVSVNVTPLQDGTGIDGVANSCTRLTSGAIGGSVQQTLVAAASSRTYSCYITRISGTGTITINQGATTLDVTASLVTNFPVLVQLNASVLNAAFGITFGASGDVILVDCNQFEAGAIATTPIPAAGTRNADVLLYTFAGNADATQGTAYAELATTYSINAPAAMTGIGFAVAAGPIIVSAATATTTIAINDGTAAVTKSGITDFSTGIRKRASSWGGSTMVTTGDGAAVASGAFDGNMGSTAIAIGVRSGGTNQWSGTVKNVSLWQVQQQNNTLRGITA